MTTVSSPRCLESKSHLWLLHFLHSQIFAKSSWFFLWSNFFSLFFPVYFIDQVFADTHVDCWMVSQEVSQCFFEQISFILIQMNYWKQKTLPLFFSKPVSGFSLSINQSLTLASLSCQIELFTSPKMCIPKAFLFLHLCHSVFFASLFFPSVLCRLYPGTSLIAIWCQITLLGFSYKQSASLIIILDNCL